MINKNNNYKSNDSSFSGSEDENNYSSSYDDDDSESSYEFMYETNKNTSKENRYIKNVSEKKLELLKKQKYRCANSPDSKLRNLVNYECLLWRLQGNNGVFDDADYELDHIIEYSISKNNDISNLQLLCPQCHAKKTSNFMKNNAKQHMILKSGKTVTKSEVNNYGIVEQVLDLKQKLLEMNDLKIITDKQLKNIVRHNMFDKCFNSVILYYERSIMDNELKAEFANKYFCFVGQRRFPKLLSIIEWLESKMKIDRFKFTKIKINDPERKKLIKKMLKNIEYFQWLSHSTKIEKRKKEITARIKKLKSEDRVKKFCMDIMNKFDDFYHYDIESVGRNDIAFYYNFKLNTDTMKNHKKIINLLDTNTDKFCDLIY